MLNQLHHWTSPLLLRLKVQPVCTIVQTICTYLHILKVIPVDFALHNIFSTTHYRVDRDTHVCSSEDTLHQP